jgi:chromosome segregation protein
LEVKISGFKSFVDGVTFTINEGLTGIVGPNGCGKSNILESIRWVMGANSAKALRGTEMDDVIFAGSDERPQRDIAEVILKVDNSEHTAPDPFRYEDIIEISRKIRRGMGSTYRINGKEVRAKDVQLLFADASSGANSPALVRQGQVSELINAKPENRRKVLEEASGISGLQARRHEAVIKLNATEANLERVSEIIITIEDQVASLKKQAQKAERYRGLAGLIRGLQAYLADTRYKSMASSVDQTNQSLGEIDNQINDCMIEINKANRAIEQTEAKLPEARQEMAIAEAVMRQLEVKKFAFERDLQEVTEKTIASNVAFERIEKDIARENEIATEADEIISRTQTELASHGTGSSSEEETEKLNKSATELNAQIKEIETKLNEAIASKAKNENGLLSLKQELARLENEKQRLGGIVVRLEKEVVDLGNSQLDENLILSARDKLEQAVKAIEQAEANYKNYLADLQKLETEDRQIRAGHDDLQNKANGLEAQIKALNAVLGRDDGKKTSLITQVQVKSGFEKPFAAAIGDDLDANLKSGDIFWNGAEIYNIEWHDVVKNAQSLDEIVSAPPELAARLHAIKIVDDNIFNSNTLPPLGCRFVTMDGDVKRWDGFVKTRNAPNAQAKRLEQKNRIIALEDELAPLKSQISEIAAKLSQTKSALASLRDKSNNERAKHPSLMMNVQNCQKSLNDLIALQARNNDRIEMARENLEQAQNNLKKITDEANEKSEIFIEQQAGLLSLSNELEKIINDTGLLLGQKRQNLADIRAKINQIIAEAQSQKAKFANLQSQLSNWTGRKENCAIRIKELEVEKTKIAAILKELSGKPDEIEEQRQKALGDLPLAEARRAKAADNLAVAESELRALQSNLRQSENSRAQLMTTQSGLQATRQSWLERVEDLKTEILNQFDCDPVDLNDYAKERLGNIYNGLDTDKAQSRLNRALLDREDLGGVNLNADVELKEQSERAQKLDSERNELVAAVKKLRNAIEEINAEGREKLLKAFDIVNGHFSQLFATLFNGGQAHLALTETDDPLGGGLEVYACPPGKRLQSMTLMSGGEQALTATALIFAVFLSNPAPLSVLDEIDAPLDDANVERFCALLNEMRNRTKTRFIVITHHPITMARMDRLFGVTMAQKGVSQLVSVDLSRAETLINA